MFCISKRRFANSKKYEELLFQMEKTLLNSEKSRYITKSTKNYSLIKSSPKYGLRRHVMFKGGSHGLIHSFVQSKAALMDFSDKLKLNVGTEIIASNPKMVIDFDPNSFGAIIDPLGKIWLNSDDTNDSENPNFGQFKDAKLDISGISENRQTSLRRVIDVTETMRIGNIFMDNFVTLPYGTSLGIFGEKHNINGTVEEVVKSILAINDTVSNSKGISKSYLARNKNVVVLAVCGYTEKHTRMLFKRMDLGGRDDIIVVACTDNNKETTTSLIPKTAFGIGKMLREKGLNALVVLNDLSMHSAWHTNLENELFGENYYSNVYSGFLADCGVYRSPSGFGSLSAICASSKNIIKKTTRVSFEAWKDVELSCDNSIHMEKELIDFSRTIPNRFKRLLPKAHRAAVNYLECFLNELPRIRHLYKIQTLVTTSYDDINKNRLTIRDKTKLLNFISNFSQSGLKITGKAEKAEKRLKSLLKTADPKFAFIAEKALSLCVLVSFCDKEILSRIFQENCVKFAQILCRNLVDDLSKNGQSLLLEVSERIAQDEVLSLRDITEIFGFARKILDENRDLEGWGLIA